MTRNKWSISDKRILLAAWGTFVTILIALIVVGIVTSSSTLVTGAAAAGAAITLLIITLFAWSKIATQVYKEKPDDEDKQV